MRNLLSEQYNIGGASSQVAVFIDYENIELSCRSIFGNDSEVDWQRIFRTAVEYGRVVIRRAYADWAIFSAGQRELLGVGVDIIHVPSKRGKNAADIRIVIDAFEMVMGNNNNITHVLLVSGDGDFTELVHRLRAHGKFVIGLGVSGASAEYLINACDQFVFYDLLVGAGGQEQFEEGGELQVTGVSFDLSEARQYLRQVIEPMEESNWVTAGWIKNAMMGLNPAFSERNYNFDSFKDFLVSQNDLVRLRTAQPGGHLEVQKAPQQQVIAGKTTAPEALLDRYLKDLAEEKVRMNLTDHRPTIILKYYEFIRNAPGRTLNQVKETMQDFFEQNPPYIRTQYIHEAAHQLFRTYCFEFDQDDSNYPADVRLWDRTITLAPDIKNGHSMLDKCDRGLLQKIMARLPEGEEINVEVAARLLYGGVKGRKMLEHVEELIQDVKRGGKKR